MLEQEKSIQPGLAESTEETSASRSHLRLVPDLETIPAEQLEAERSERDERLTRWLNGMAEVQDMFGKEGISRALGILQSKGPKTEVADIQEAFQDLGTRQEFQEHFFAKLERLGVMEYVENDCMVVDIDHLLEVGFQDVRDDSLRKGGEFRSYHNGSAKNFWYELFRDKQVISKADYKVGVREPKPLFYTPETTADAYAVDKIKEADFYLGLWDMKGTNATGKDGKVVYPSTYDELDYYAVEAAAKIYHPKYGNAERDEHGVLWVTGKDGQRKKFSSEWLSKEANWYGPVDKDTRAGAVNRPIEYLNQDGRVLVEHDLLRTDDFKMFTGTETEKKYRFVAQGVGANGQIMIDSIRYFLGRNFVNQPIRVYKISPGLAGVVRYDGNGKETLEYTFNLLAQDDKRLKKYQDKNMVSYGAPKSAIDFKPMQGVTGGVRRLRKIHLVKFWRCPTIFRETPE